MVPEIAEPRPRAADENRQCQQREKSRPFATVPKFVNGVPEQIDDEDRKGAVDNYARTVMQDVLVTENTAVP